MTMIFKNLGGVTRDCDGSTNVCAGQVAVGVRCNIQIESLNPNATYSAPVNLPKVWNGVLRERYCWRTTEI